MADIDEKEQNGITTPDEQENTASGQKNTANDDLKDYMDADGNFDAEKVRKLASDKKYYRQQISKLRQVPESVEEYSKDFVLDSKFDEFVQNEDNRKKINGIFEKLDKLSLEKGLSVERNNDMRRFVLDELIENKAIDLTSAAKKAEMEQKVLAERNSAVQESIGDISDIDAWNTQVLDWLKTFCNNSAEYELHKHLFETNSTWALSLNKMRQAMLGNRIPVIHSDPTFNEAEWQRSFLKADKDTQDKMLQARAEELTKNKQ